MIWPHVTAPSCSRDAWLPPETPGRAADVTQNAPGGPGGSLGVAPVVSLREEGGGGVEGKVSETRRQMQRMLLVDFSLKELLSLVPSPLALRRFSRS